MTGSRLTSDQCRAAAAMLVSGDSKEAVARAVGKSARTIRRALADPEHALAKAVARRRREQDHADHVTAVRQAARAGAPRPSSPAQVRDERLAHERAARQLQRERAETVVRDRGTPDNEVIRWVLAHAAVESEEDWLDYRDAARGVASPRARERFRGIMRRRQFRIVSFPTTAEANGFFDGGTPAWTRDPFQGLYGGRD